MKNTIRIRPKHVMIVLLVIIALLVLADIGSQLSLLMFDNDLQKFDVELENNIPTWFSSAILLISALLFSLIAALKWSGKDRFALQWTGLAAMLFLMSADETASVHEMFNMKALPMVHIDPDLWIVIAAPVLLGIGVLYFRFFMDLPARTRNLLLLAAGIYFFGALGMETIAINDVIQVLYRGYNAAYSLLTLIEETMEMLGVALLIYALLGYVGQEFRLVSVQVDAAEPLVDSPSEKLIASPNTTK